MSSMVPILAAAAAAAAAVLVGSHRVDGSGVPPTRPPPTVLLALIMDDERLFDDSTTTATILPRALAYVENVDFPKRDVGLYVRRSGGGRKDEGDDGTTTDSAADSIVRAWLGAVGDEYHSLRGDVFEVEGGGAEEEEEESSIRGSSSSSSSTRHDDDDDDDDDGKCRNRRRRFAEAMEGALIEGRSIGAKYVWFATDGFSFLANDRILADLVENAVDESSTIVAPLLVSVDSESNNFVTAWADDDGNAVPIFDDRYKFIRDRERRGCFAVPHVDGSVLVDLRREESERLTFLPEKLGDDDDSYDDDYGCDGGPSSRWDPMRILSESARRGGAVAKICNDEPYGTMLPKSSPLASGDDDDDAAPPDVLRRRRAASDMQIDTIFRHGPLPKFKDDFARSVATPLLAPAPSSPSNRVDKTYLINLERRPERKAQMDSQFDVLGMEVEWIKAVDGRTLLDDEVLERIRYDSAAGYKDPYTKRSYLTEGEIGCFLSHYLAWVDVLESDDVRTALVLEDDAKLRPNFRQRIDELFDELDRLSLDWDLVYVGRKRMKDEETYVADSDFLLMPKYSHWTVGYLLSESGARKLIEAEPLQRMVPVDEFLPIMYGKNPHESWSENFADRGAGTLNAYAVHPVALEPALYPDEEGYFSDTENSSSSPSPETTAPLPRGKPASVASREFRPSPTSRRIPRETNLSSKEFRERYSDRRVPVIIRDYARLFANVTAEEIKKRCGEEVPPIARLVRRSNDGRYGAERLTYDVSNKKTLTRVLRDPSLGEGDVRTIGVRDWSLPQRCPTLLEGGRFSVPKYFARDYIARPTMPKTSDDALDDDEERPSLFVGAAGSRDAPSSHGPSCGYDVWEYVVEGRKEYHVVDFDASYGFFASDDSDSDDDDVDVAHYHDVLEPGEMLFIPGGAFRQGRNLGSDDDDENENGGGARRTVSVVGEFLSRGTARTMRPPGGTEGASCDGVVEAIRDATNVPGFDDAIDYGEEDITWDRYSTIRRRNAVDVRKIIVVSGAGSEEVNGVYRLNGMNGGADQFELLLRDDDDKDGGRAFELFKVPGTAWWNIQERVGDSYLPVHYGSASGDMESLEPPSKGWMGILHKRNWRGKSPHPTLEVRYESASW